jgi:hypothetical protein
LPAPSVSSPSPPSRPHHSSNSLPSILRHKLARKNSWFLFAYSWFVSWKLCLGVSVWFAAVN